jgi:DNA ligase-1
MKTTDVPWANVIDPKTGNIKHKIRPFATGLWSRYGNPIMAPDWWLNGLPCIPLDGELFAGRGNFQITMSAVRKDNPIDSEWQLIQFAVYSSPSFSAVFCSGEIKNANFHCVIDGDIINSWINVRASNIFENDLIQCHSESTFDNELNLINAALETHTDFAYLHQQIRLPNDNNEAKIEAEHHLERILALGGEGIIIRSGKGFWFPKRVSHVLKYKPYFDAEARIVGFTSGRLGKEGKMLGKIGAIITNFNGKRLEISGLTDNEREFSNSLESEFALHNPGIDMPKEFQGKYFKPGDVISFKYRELSDQNIPKEARYFR